MSRFAGLTREQLVARLEALDPGPSKRVKQKQKISPRSFDFSHHPTRHVALLVSYLGWPYSGLAIQSKDGEDIPTVEAELQKALEKTRLIEQGKGWEGCGYSRCGRTDRGVSGSGQVVTLYVRSNRTEEVIGWKPAVNPPPPKPTVDKEGNEIIYQTHPGEYAYPRLLNNVLPPSIRILGWSPISHHFDARFSCTSRHYKYAFHLQPPLGIPPLDLELMTTGMNYLRGEHDFRNFCKVDGSKQIENHSRCVKQAWFEEGNYPGVMVFNLVGSAFLWHQVRHIMGILFLVGTKLESPSVVLELLDVVTNPAKPAYQMANPLPLTLYSCSYSEPLDWRLGPYDGEIATMPAGEKLNEKDLQSKVERSLEEQRQDAEIRTWQVGGAIQKLRNLYGEPVKVDMHGSHPMGGGEMVITSKFQKIIERARGPTPDEVNRRWREKNGVKASLDKTEEGE